jgi:hypothetical protein
MALENSIITEKMKERIKRMKNRLVNGRNHTEGFSGFCISSFSSFAVEKYVIIRQARISKNTGRTMATATCPVG